MRFMAISKPCPRRGSPPPAIRAPSVQEESFFTVVPAKARESGNPGAVGTSLARFRGTTMKRRCGCVGLSVKDAPGVDDDSLAGHGLGAAHGDHHRGAVVLVGGFLQERSRCRAL